MSLDESTVEAAALQWLQALGYTICHGRQFAPGEAVAEQEGFGDVMLIERLRLAIQPLNPVSGRSKCTTLVDSKCTTFEG